MQQKNAMLDMLYTTKNAMSTVEKKTKFCRLSSTLDVKNIKT